MTQIETALVYFVTMLVSLTFHEAAHALVATLKGDSTAKDRGRLSLNPLRHADLFGTVLLPLAGALSHAPILGWAKPVPVDLRNLKRPRWDYLQVAAAGPLANLLLAAVAMAVGMLVQPEAGWAKGLFTALMSVNAYLAVFNLLPLPPLDGGTVAAALLPPGLGDRYLRVVRPYGFFVLIVAMYAGALNWLPELASGYLVLVHGMLSQAFGLI